MGEHVVCAVGVLARLLTPHHHKATRPIVPRLRDAVWALNALKVLTIGSASTFYANVSAVLEYCFGSTTILQESLLQYCFVIIRVLLCQYKSNDKGIQKYS